MPRGILFGSIRHELIYPDGNKRPPHALPGESINTSGFKNLDKAALKGLSACKFKAGTKDGAPAQTWTKVDYAWKLD
jgi:hypothetical protein